MTQDNVVKLIQPAAFSDPLTEVLREGARALLAQAVEAEVTAFLSGHADRQTEDGRPRLVRHGHRPERAIMTGLGPVAVRAPRVRDRTGAGESRIRFPSAILPPYARRSKSLGVLSRSSLSKASPAAILKTRSRHCSARTRVGCPPRASPD